MSYSSVYTTVSGAIVDRISGAIVTCRTSSNIRITTAPPRWIMPKMGGFSLARVPRPRSPFSRRRRGGRPFFNRLGMALMSGHDIHFVAFDLAAEDLDGLALDDPFAEPRGHHLGLVGVEIQLLPDLLVGEVQAHEVEAEDPGLQRLVMAGEDGAGEIIEEPPTGVAAVALACRLGRVVALLGDPPAGAVGAGHPLGPAEVADGLEAL